MSSSRRSASVSSPISVPALVLGAVLVPLPLIALAGVGDPDLRLALIVVGFVASLAGAWMIVADKRQAEASANRTPEATLHLVELLGGWPGSYFAQRIVRHKTAKISYQAQFWLIVLLHQAVALDLVAHGALRRWIMDWVRQHVL